MDNIQPMAFDARTKHRKAKENPYELLTTGIAIDHPHYYLSFTDSGGMKQFMEIDEILFKAFSRFELDDLFRMNRMDRHYERSAQTEISLHVRAMKPQLDLEKTVLQKVEAGLLHKAIVRLLDIQRCRLILYYFVI